MIKIGVLTATRAEYGLLSPVIKAMIACEEFDVKVIVTGAHLSAEYGLTYKDIENDDVKIDRRIEILTSADTPTESSKSMGLAMIKFAEYFEESKPDMLMVLGDRYETLAVCCAALHANIPIVHLHGGETTQGAVDEAMRHAITKMSYLHFTSTEEYRRRVIQLGETPERVFNVGAVGVENALHTELMTKKELEESIQFDLGDQYCVVTFHPVTLESGNAKAQFQELLDAMSAFPHMRYIITKANADAEGRVINDMIAEYVSQNSNAVMVASLGTVRYLSAVKYCAMVMGNSSSGIIEVPSLKKPTINIGDRQKGRIQAHSIINCPPKKERIVAAMENALSKEFRGCLQDVVNPYGDGNTSKKIVNILSEYVKRDKLSLKKEFYDLN